jgi:predicted ester cyclase
VIWNWTERRLATIERPITRRLLGRLSLAGVTALAAGSLPRRLAVAQEATPCPPTTSEEARAIGEAYFAAFNAGDADALDALLAPDYHQAGALVTPQDREIHLQRLRTNHAAFPDGHYELGDIIANGDLVAIRHVFSGTLQEPYFGVEPTGQPVMVRGVHIHRIACGKIVETWNSGDGIGLLRQIGALPPAGPSPRTPVDATQAAATPAADCPPTTTEESAELGRRWTEDALDTHNLDLYDEFVAADLVHHAGIFVDEIGRDALKEDLGALIAAFPDVRFTADVIVAEGDRAAVRWTGRGTHDGTLQGIAPTGREVTFSGINIYRIACGQIVEGWSEPDVLSLLNQLGVLPPIEGLTPPADMAATPAA